MDVADGVVDEELGDEATTQTPSIERQLETLATMFAEKIQYDQQKEKAFDKLYQELDIFKNDFVEKRMREIYTDLLLLYDNVKSYLAREDVQAPENTVARECLGYALEEILEVLYRRGIEPIALGSDVFDPRYQRALKTVATNCPNDDGKVTKIIKDGFCKGNTVLRHQAVVVARWQDEERVDL